MPPARRNAWHARVWGFCASPHALSEGRRLWLKLSRDECRLGAAATRDREQSTPATWQRLIIKSRTDLGMTQGWHLADIARARRHVRFVGLVRTSVRTKKRVSTLAF